MNKELRRDLFDYILLIGGLAGIVFLFVIVWPDRFWMRVISVALGFFYVGWGLYSHWNDHHLSAKIFWEYLAVAIVGVTLLWLLAW